MQDLIEHALTASVDTAATSTVNAAIVEAGAQADRIVGVGPLPGTAEWEAEQDSEIPAQRQMAWQLACLRIQLAAGVDSTGPAILDLSKIRGQPVLWSHVDGDLLAQLRTREIEIPVDFVRSEVPPRHFDQHFVRARNDLVDGAFDTHIANCWF